MNKCSTKSVKKKVPQEAWTRMKHNVAHLKVFGCVAYTHVPYELRKRLYNKGKNVYLLDILKIQKHTNCMIILQGKS
jgi:hypothetical protein